MTTKRTNHEIMDAINEKKEEIESNIRSQNYNQEHLEKARFHHFDHDQVLERGRRLEKELEVLNNELRDN